MTGDKKTLNFSISSAKIANIGMIRHMFNMSKEKKYHEDDYDRLYYCLANIYLPPLYANVYGEICCL